MLFISDCSITIVWNLKCDYIVYSHGQCRKVTYHRFSFINTFFFPRDKHSVKPFNNVNDTGNTLNLGIDNSVAGGDHCMSIFLTTATNFA
jgi:hypothetical protein